MDYAERHGIQATIVEPQKRATNIRPGGYGGKFRNKSSWCLDPIRLPSYHVKEAASGALVPDLKT